LPVVDRRLTARGEERRQQLLDTATRMFAERGYHPTSVADIVDGVGVGKGVFYWYFESKEQLFLELMARARDDMRLAQVAFIADEPDPVRRLEGGIRASLDWLESHRDIIALFQIASVDTRFASALRQAQEDEAAQLATHLKDAIATGRIPDGDPLVLAHAVLGAVEALARTFLMRPGAWDQGVADTAVAFCLGGVLATRGPSALS
jgi:AcrR family transcriptional regulator